MRCDSNARRGWRWTGRASGIACVWAGALAAGIAPAFAEPVNVSLSATTGVFRDENFFRNSVNVEEKDLGGLGLTLRIGQERPRLTYDLQYVPSFQREFDSPHFTAEDHRLELAGVGLLSERTRLRVSERLVRSDVETDLLSSNAVLVVPRTERFEHSLDVTLAHELGRRNELELGVVHQIYEYETVQLFDGTAYGASLGYAWRREDDTRLQLLGRAFRHEPDGRDGTDVVTAGARYRKPLDRWHELTFDAGAFQARAHDPDPGRDGSENGWYGGVAYSWSPGRRAVSSVQLRRDVSPAPGVGFSTVADLAQITSTLTLRERVRLDLSGQGARHRFLFESEQVTESVLADARLRWELRNGIELSGGIGWIHQRSDIPELDDLDYNRYFVGTSFPIYRRGRVTSPGVLPGPTPTPGG